jgi:hypothetical protein
MGSLQKWKMRSICSAVNSGSSLWYNAQLWKETHTDHQVKSAAPDAEATCFLTGIMMAGTWNVSNAATLKSSPLLSSELARMLPG